MISHDKTRFLPFLSVTFLLLIVFYGVAGYALFSRVEDPYMRSWTALIFFVCAFTSLILFAVFFIALYLLLIYPLSMLSHEVRIVAGVNPGYVISRKRSYLAGDIWEAVRELADAFMRSRREIAEVVSAGSGELERSRSRLETILSSLREGIIVCDDRARIMFYNPAARRIMQDSPALGLGLSLYQLFPESPVENSLSMLRQQKLRDPGGADSIPFVSTTLIGTIVNCNIRLLPDVSGLPWHFLLTCEDISRYADAEGRRENVINSALTRMRISLTDLGLAIDSLEMLPEMGADDRLRLEHSVSDNVRAITGQFGLLSRELEEMGSQRHPAGDVYSEDVVSFVARKIGQMGITLTMIGDPLWVKAELHSLIRLVEFLVLGIREHSHAGTIEVETLMGDKRAYFNFIWHGDAVPEAVIRQWKTARMAQSDREAVGELLGHMGSEIWSRPHVMPGYAVLCLPVPSSTRQWETSPVPLPSRPVYSDFTSYDIPDEMATLGDARLDRIPFVVFDTETTGLAPLEGDEIVSIGGVKIVNGGIVVGETFDSLVNPNRPIPVTSTGFHGINDAMVTGSPSIEDTLRSFRRFVGDSVLVGHNAAFDMRFIRLKEKSAGVNFVGPVLDTLSMSLFLHDHTPEHSLDAVARRLGVAVKGRHTALGDALITAQVFIKFIYLFQGRGITTMAGLKEALRR